MKTVFQSLLVCDVVVVCFDFACTEQSSSTLLLTLLDFLLKSSACFVNLYLSAYIYTSSIYIFFAFWGLYS